MLRRPLLCKVGVFAMFAQTQYKSFVQTLLAQTQYKSFVQTFSKVCAVKGAEPLSPPQWRNSLIGVLFFVSFSLAPLVSREKDKDCLGRLLNTYILISLFICSTDIFDIPFPAFFFDTSGAKKKACKKETPSRDALRALP